jgi:hypothetical protein
LEEPRGLLDPEDDGTTPVRNVGIYLSVDTVFNIPEDLELHGEPLVSQGARPVFPKDSWALVLRVFENRVLRRFGPKRDGVTGEWRRVHNEEHNDLY